VRFLGATAQPIGSATSSQTIEGLQAFSTAQGVQVPAFSPQAPVD